MPITRKVALLLVILAGIVPLHAGSTKMVSSWFAPEAKGAKFKKLLAVVVTRSVGTRHAAEDEMVNLLSRRGNDAQASYEVLSEMELEDPSGARPRIAASGADGVVVLRLHAFNSSKKDQPSVRSNDPPASSISGPMTTEFTFFSPHPSPGELTYTQLVIEVEILVYSLKEDKLLWHGVSRTKNPMGARVVVQEITEEAIKTMKKQGLVAK